MKIHVGSVAKWYAYPYDVSQVLGCHVPRIWESDFFIRKPMRYRNIACGDSCKRTSREASRIILRHRTRRFYTYSNAKRTQHDHRRRTKQMPCLLAVGEQMNYFNHDIDVMVATHPDADHVTGLIPVMEKYDVHAYCCFRRRKRYGSIPKMSTDHA
jgi:hypothetical protein